MPFDHHPDDTVALQRHMRERAAEANRTSSAAATKYRTMRNDPPTRLALPLPTSQPLAIITASGGPASHVPSRYPTKTTVVGEPRGGSAGHSLVRPPSDAVPLPAFAFNTVAARAFVAGEFVVPTRLAGRAPQTPEEASKSNRTTTPRSSAASAVPTASARWVEPHPSNLRRGGRVLLQEFAASLLQCIFVFCPSFTLDLAIVRVCRLWAFSVKQSLSLTSRRFAFVPAVQASADAKHSSTTAVAPLTLEEPTRSSSNATLHAVVASVAPSAASCVYDGGAGILAYLATTRAIGVLCSGGSPARGPSPAIRIAQSRLGGCTAVHPARAVAPEAPLSMASFVSATGSCRSDAMPFAWIGVDFGLFRVIPSHYRIRASVGAGQSPMPVEWELQGSVDPEWAPSRDGLVRRPLPTWGECSWTVIDRRTASTAAFSTTNPVCTFAIPSSAIAGRGALRLLRIVQTGRNSQWGQELVCGGFEVYGRLFHSKGGSPM